MKKLYLLNDYLTSKLTMSNVEQYLKNKFDDFEIINIDYTKFYEHIDVDKIDLNSVIEFFSDELKSKIAKDDVLVGIGTSCRILTNFEQNKKILINPLLFNNLINVFIANGKYWINSKEQHKIYLDKFINLDEINIEKEYEWYSQNYNKILKLTEKISLYETLKSLIEKDSVLFKNSLVVLSENNQILDNKISLKYLNKKLIKKTNFNLEISKTNKHLVIK